MPELIVAAAQLSERFGDVDERVRAHVFLAELAVEQGARLLIFPELSLTGYGRTLTRTDAIALGDARLAPLSSLARQRAITIVVGAPVASAQGLHIGALAISPDGSGSVYQKEFLHTGEEMAFAPGTGNHVLQFSGEVLGFAVCADVVHAEHAAQAAQRGTTIYAAGCYVTERGYPEFQENLSAYAAQHHMLVMMANFAAPTRDFDCAGRSAIWSPAGDLIASAEKTGQAIVLARRQNHVWCGDVLPVG